MGKKSSKASSKTVYGNTTTSNPYVTSVTNNSGTTSRFNAGTAFDTINNFVNTNMNTMLDEYLNPTLNSVTNQAKLKSYTDTLNNQTSQNLENNIINPLSNRNMLRSSQATDLYKNLAQTNANLIGNYANDLIADSQQNSADMISNLLSYYLNGYNVLSNNQGQSLATSQGNARTSQKASQTNLDFADIASQLISAFLGKGSK